MPLDTQLFFEGLLQMFKPYLSSILAELKVNLWTCGIIYGLSTPERLKLTYSSNY